MQMKLKDMFSNNASQNVVSNICKWMLYNGLPFNSAKSLYYHSMIDMVEEAKLGVRGSLPVKHYLLEQGS